MKDDKHVLPRDIEAEKEALRLAREIFDDPHDDDDRHGHIEFVHTPRGVVAEARSPLLHGSRLEVAVRGDTSRDAARRLVVLLHAYLTFRPMLEKKGMA
jgi:hypothetical protein